MYLTSHFFQKRGSPTDPLITLLNIRVMDRTLSPGWDMLLIYIYFLISTILNQKSSMTAKYALKIADILKKINFLATNVRWLSNNRFVCCISVIYNRLFVACLAIQLLLPNKLFFGDFGN